VADPALTLAVARGDGPLRRIHDFDFEIKNLNFLIAKDNLIGRIIR
jgi:hypothetical protein